MRTIAIIQARMGSTRLPGKGLIDICGKPAIERVINRIKAVNILQPGLIDDIIVATTLNIKDNAIMEWCNKNDVPCYRGSENNVLERFYLCAIENGADWIVRVTGDCPLIEPVMVYGLLTKKPRKQYQALAFNHRRIPGGWDCELLSMDLLKQRFKSAETDKEREHVTIGMRRSFDDSCDYGTDFRFDKIDLELNTPESLERIRRYEKLL